MQVDPIKPTLKSPGTMCLKLKHGKLLSSFAFNVNLRRYNAGYHTARYMFPVGYRAVRRVAGGMPALAEALADAALEAPAGAYTRPLLSST